MTTITLQLSEDTERRLRAKASTAGKPLETFLHDLVEREAQAITLPPVELSHEEWVKEWRAFVDSRPVRPVIADDSRESIYEGRGE